MTEQSYIEFNQEEIEKDLNSEFYILDTGDDMSLEAMLEALHNMSSAKPLDPELSNILNNNILDLF